MISSAAIKKIEIGCDDQEEEDEGVICINLVVVVGGKWAGTVFPGACQTCPSVTFFKGEWGKSLFLSPNGFGRPCIYYYLSAAD